MAIATWFLAALTWVIFTAIAVIVNMNVLCSSACQRKKNWLDDRY